MSEISEEEDALLAELLLNTDLVNEQDVKMVRQLKRSLREQGVRVSIVDLLIQSGFLSRSDLNTLRAEVDEKIDGGASILPPRFAHPFLTQQDLDERAKEEGVITEETYQKVERIRRMLDENGVNKTGGEILVEQGFVEPHELDFEEGSSDEEGMFDEITSDKQESVSSAPDSNTQKEKVSRASVISELDRYVFEELIDRGRMERAQIPTIVQKAREKKEESGGASPVQTVLREQGLLHPSTESEVVSAAMDRQDEAERWQNQFSNVGPMTVTIVLVICVVSVFFLLYGSGDDQGAQPADTSLASKTEPQVQEQETLQNDSVSSAARSSDQRDTEQRTPDPLVTFRAEFGPALEGLNCDCEVLFDGQFVTNLSGKVEEKGRFDVKLLPDSGQGHYAPGGYLLRCTLRDTPGADFPNFPSQFRNALEEHGPANNVLFEKFLNEELWNFATFAILGSSELDDDRGAFVAELRNNVQAIINQGEKVKKLLAEKDPESDQLLSEYDKLHQACGQVVEQLNEKRKHRSFYYPSVRHVVRDQMRELPKVIARIMVKQRRSQNIEVTDELRKLSGSGTGGTMQSVQAIIDSLRNQRDQLPAEGEQVNPLYSFEPVVVGELRKLAEVVRVLSLLRNNKEVRRQAIEQNQEMVKYMLIALFKYIYYQIQLRSILLDRTSQLRVFDDDTAGRIDKLSERMGTYLQRVVVDLAEANNVDLPEQISEVEGSVESVRSEVVDRFRRVGIDVLSTGKEE